MESICPSSPNKYIIIVKINITFCENCVGYLMFGILILSGLIIIILWSSGEVCKSLYDLV